MTKTSLGSLALLLALLAAPAVGQDEADLAAWARNLDKKGVAIVYANRLAMAGWKATPHVLPLLESGSEEEKKRVLWILLRTLDVSAVPALRSAIERGEEIELACRVLARLEAVDAVPFLLARVEADPDRAEAYVSALGVLGGEEGLAGLRRVLRERPGLAMRAALGLLVHVPEDGQAREALLALSRSESESDRLAATWAMGRSRDPHFLPRIEESLGGAAALRAAAIDALGEIGGDRAAAVLRPLAGRAAPDGPERLALARALWKATGSDADLEALVARIDEVLVRAPRSRAEYDQRVATIGELGNLPLDVAQARLARFVGDPPASEGELLEVLRLLDARDDLLERFLPALSRMLGNESLSVKAYAWMLAERATRSIYEWPTSFERLALEGASGGRAELTLGLAHTERLRRTGAMFLPGLSDGVGILFVRPEPDQVRMWMKYTFFGLDVAFLDESGRIVQIESLDPPAPGTDSAQVPSAMPDRPVRFVVEVRKGWFRERGFRVGDRFALTPRVLRLKAE